nr:PREDICTED: splicing factor, arginine/serine-rich 19 [Apteryx mantelli mantelli]
MAVTAVRETSRVGGGHSGGRDIPCRRSQRWRGHPTSSAGTAVTGTPSLLASTVVTPRGRHGAEGDIPPACPPLTPLPPPVSPQYLKKLHTQERAVEEVKLAIKPYYQKKEITKDEYKDILRKAVHKICHSKSGEINPVKVNNLVKAYVQRYKYFRKRGRRVEEEPGGPPKELGGPLDKAPLPMPPL